MYTLRHTRKHLHTQPHTHKHTSAMAGTKGKIINGQKALMIYELTVKFCYKN
jgi:hypothetical protein